jgi:ABC-type transport system involved in cytochrome c biogenesis permease subunit
VKRILIALAPLWIGLLILFSVRSPPPTLGFDTDVFGRLPVLLDGRIQPMDTVARNALLILSSKSSPRIEVDGLVRKILPAEWLATLLFAPEVAEQWAVIRIYNEELKDELGLPLAAKDFPFSALKGHFSLIERQAMAARQIEAPRRDAYQRASVKLYDKLMLHLRLSRSLWTYDRANIVGEWDSFTGHLVAPEANSGLTALFRTRYARMAELSMLRLVPAAGGEYVTVGDALLRALETGEANSLVGVYLKLAEAFRADQVPRFNELMGGLELELQRLEPSSRPRIEQRYNQFSPLLRAMVGYLLGGILVCVAWVRWPQRLLPLANWAIWIGFALHTIGLLFRMYLQGRPPVTNLYSSAVFVGWGATLFGLMIERRTGQGLGALTAASIGFASLVVAQGLAASGDTLEQMQAVLDSNFWLSTHVVTITLGYSATFLAGFIGIVYVLRLWSGQMDRASTRDAATLAFGVSLFALLLSFVGTVLGGIWADQSWGRFWGWDPKENGAVMIVIWNAIILHVRLSGLLRDHGILLAIIFGNVITAFSWFGVNMLGIGLHSYGFMEQAFFWLLLFCGSQMLIIALGAIGIAKRFGRIGSQELKEETDG